MITILITLAIAAVIFTSAQMWRLGGDGKDLLRNPGVPILIGVVKAIICMNV